MKIRFWVIVGESSGYKTAEWDGDSVPRKGDVVVLHDTFVEVLAVTWQHPYLVDLGVKPYTPKVLFTPPTES